MKRLVFVCTVCLAAMTFSNMSARAEGDDEAVNPVVLAYVKARNQLGLMHYCKEKGFTGDAEIAGQKKILSYVPIPEGLLDDAEAAQEMQDVEDKGKIGQIVDDELDLYRISDVAKARNETEEVMCKAIGKIVVEASAKMPDKK